MSKGTCEVCHGAPEGCFNCMPMASPEQEEMAAAILAAYKKERNKDADHARESAEA